MSGEVNYRNYAGTPGKNPKYLSDSLTPWYGAWYDVVGAPITNIAYDSLPSDGSIRARIYQSLSGFNIIMFQFNEPQNVLDFELTFYYKENSNEFDTYLYLSSGDKTTWSSVSRGYVALNGPGAAPLTWTKKTYTINRYTFGSGGIIYADKKNRDYFASRLRTIEFYVGAGVTPPHILEISGMNIRRL